MLSPLHTRPVVCFVLPAPVHSPHLETSEAIESSLKRHKVEANYDSLWEKFLSLVFRSLTCFSFWATSMGL